MTEIGKATETELAAIEALETACFSCPRSRDEIGRALGNFSAAFCDGVFAGYADLTAVLDEGYIGNIAVVPAFRRRGVGAALLGELLRQGEAAKLAFLTLEVRAQNMPARRLYEKCGFETVGVRKKVYEKPTDDAIIMTCYL